jgi:hypothetical protein
MQEVEIREAEPKSLETLLEYFYTGVASQELTIEVRLALLSLARPLDMAARPPFFTSLLCEFGCKAARYGCKATLLAPHQEVLLPRAAPACFMHGTWWSNKQEPPVSCSTRERGSQVLITLLQHATCICVSVYLIFLQHLREGPISCLRACRALEP